MKRFVLGVISLGLVSSGLLGPAMATAAADLHPLVLETSPLPISLVADPGTTVTTDIRVKQAGPGDAKLQVKLQKFGAFGDQGKPKLMDPEPGDQFVKWVKFDKTEFDAPANVWQTIHMTISLPKTAAFGYYYAAVISRVGDDIHRDNRTNSIAGATAVLVLLEARNPNANRTLVLKSFASIHRIYEFLPSTFNLTLGNTGNVHAVPHGDIFIKQNGKQLAVLPINSGGGNILPQSNRIFPVKWTDGYPSYQDVLVNGAVKINDKGHQVQTLSWDPGGNNPFTKLRMGKYTAELFAVYDNGHNDVPIEATVTFWVIPWRFLLAMLVLIALVGLGVYLSVRGTLRRATRGLKRLRRR